MCNKYFIIFFSIKVFVILKRMYKAITLPATVSIHYGLSNVIVDDSGKKRIACWVVEVVYS